MSNPSDPALDTFRGGDSVRVGTDLCSVQDVADSVERYGDRYLRRVYTDHELEYCSSDPARSAERLAARFAAKEATVKVLRPNDARPDWRTIEVRRDPSGWCELSLTGSAARRRARGEDRRAGVEHEPRWWCRERRRGRNDVGARAHRRDPNMTADRVREIVAAHTRLAVDVATLADGDDLYSAGLTSHASVNLMLALEDAFDIEFPERLLRRQTFESIAAISAAIDDLALESA